MTQKRKRLSDLHAPVTNQTFKEQFPTIAALTIEITQHRSQSGKVVLKENSPSDRAVNCKNPLCFRGGILPGDTISDMVHKRGAEWAGTVPCVGSERAESRSTGLNCLWAFEIK